jgi:hypothetical protein
VQTGDGENIIKVVRGALLQEKLDFAFSCRSPCDLCGLAGDKIVGRVGEMDGVALGCGESKSACRSSDGEE